MELRPLSIGELFDRAFMLYRRHFRLFVGVTAIPGVFALLMTLAQQVLQRAATPDPFAEGDSAAALENVAFIFWMFAGMMTAFVIYSVVYMVALGATTFAVSELYLGRMVTISSVYARMRGRIGALVLLLLLIGVRVGAVAFVGLLLMGFVMGLGTIFSPVLGGLAAFFVAMTTFALCLFLGLRYGVSIPVLVIEGLRPNQSIARSVELTRGRLGRVFLLVLCATMVTYAALTLFQGPFFAAALMVGIESPQGFWLNIAGAVFGTIGTTLTSPFMIIGLALIYYDARIREEGFDLEVTLASLDAARA